MNRRSHLEITLLSGLMLIGIVAFGPSSPSATPAQTATVALSDRLNPLRLAQVPAHLRRLPQQPDASVLPSKPH